MFRNNVTSRGLERWIIWFVESPMDDPCQQIRFQNETPLKIDSSNKKEKCIWYDLQWCINPQPTSFSFYPELFAQSF